MSFIEIDKKPVIFDDPEYCETDPELKNYEACKKFDDSQEKCWEFGHSLDGDDNLLRFKKHGECRTAWRKAKAQQSKPCHECKELRNINEHGAYVCPCPHCGDEVPF